MFLLKFFKAFSLNFELTGPVFIVLIKILLPRTSCLKVSFIPSIAYLLALYAPLYFKEIIPKTELCCMIFP